MINKDKITDVVLIHVNNRPEMIYMQLTSFIDSQFDHNEICGTNHKILFLVVGDHTNEYVIDSFQKYMRLVKTRINRKNLAQSIDVMFVDKKRQEEMMHQVRQMHLPDEHLQAIFYDAHTGKLGGQRGIQNLSVLAAHYFLNGSKNYRNILMHRLDDDMFPICMRHEREGVYSVKEIPSFFCRKRMAISERKARILSSYYTIDTPSQIVDLFEAVEAVHIVTESITAQNIKTGSFNWNNVANKLYVYGAPKEVVIEGLSEQLQDMLNVQSLRETSDLSSILKQIKGLLDLLAICVNRFEYNLANFTEEFNWSVPRESLPGGCVTSFIGEEFAPGPNFGTHDVMWSCLEFNKRGGTFGDFPLGHIKTGSDRPLFVGNLISDNDTGMRCDHAYACHAMKRLKSIYNKDNDDFMTSEKEFTEFGVFGKKIVSETKERMIRIQEKLSHINNTSAVKITEFFYPLVQNYEVIAKRYGDKQIDEQEAVILTDKWLESEDSWLKIRSAIQPH